MTKPTFRKKRSKLAMILFMPIFSIVFMAGWSLYCIGQSWHQNTNLPQKPINNTPTKQEETELIMIPQEKQIRAN